MWLFSVSTCKVKLSIEYDIKNRIHYSYVIVLVKISDKFYCYFTLYRKSAGIVCKLKKKHLLIIKSSFIFKGYVSCICNIMSRCLIDLYVFTGIKCFTILENITNFVDNGDTVVLNCTCSREKSSWQGPDGTKALRTETVLMTYSDGQQINPDLNIPNIDIYGNFTIGLCHLRVNNFSNANDGTYLCTYLHNAVLYVSYFNIYSKSKFNKKKIKCN